MFYPWMFPIMMKPIPTIDEQPPTIYYLLRAIVDDEDVKTSMLADRGREYIFDFEYPLTDKITKKDFETMILNKFMMRRIGTETLTSFKINLSVKLNEIMPLYNKLFDSIDGWDLFNDGEVTSRELTDSKQSESHNNITNNSSTQNISDRRYSDTPQNKLNQVQNGTYLSDYNFDTSNGTDSSTTNGVLSSNDNTSVNEIIRRSPSDKIAIYKDFIENKQNIYSMIFKDLDELFYQLV